MERSRNVRAGVSISISVAVALGAVETRTWLHCAHSNLRGPGSAADTSQETETAACSEGQEPRKGQTTSVAHESVSCWLLLTG
jgi:hypothetical protein